MAGRTLGIGETNPKVGAVQYDARRIDAVPLIINPAATGVSDGVPVGTICTLQEDPDTTKQYVVTGLAAIAKDAYSNTMKILATGGIEIASRSGMNGVAPTTGMFKTGDSVAFVRSIDEVIMSPIDADDAIDATNLGIGAAYVTKAGKLAKTSNSSANAAFTVGIVFKGSPSLQMKGQLKTGFAFVRIVQ